MTSSLQVQPIEMSTLWLPTELTLPERFSMKVGDGCEGVRESAIQEDGSFRNPITLSLVIGFALSVDLFGYKAKGVEEGGLRGWQEERNGPSRNFRPANCPLRRTLLP